MPLFFQFMFIVVKVNPLFFEECISSSALDRGLEASFCFVIFQTLHGYASTELLAALSTSLMINPSFCWCRPNFCCFNIYCLFYVRICIQLYIGYIYIYILMISPLDIYQLYSYEMPMKLPWYPHWTSSKPKWNPKYQWPFNRNRLIEDT